MLRLLHVGVSAPLREAIGDIQSALADIDLCIQGDSIRPKDHSPEGIRQIGVLISPQVDRLPVLQFLEWQNSCTKTQVSNTPIFI